MRRLIILLAVLLGGAATLWHFERERRQEYERDREGELSSEGDAFSRSPVNGGPEAGESPTAQGEPAQEVPEDDGPVDMTKRRDGDPGEGTEDKPVIHRGEKAQAYGASTSYRTPKKPGEPWLDVKIENVELQDDVGFAYELQNLEVDSLEAVMQFDENGEPLPMAAARKGELQSRIVAARAYTSVDSPSIGDVGFSDSAKAKLEEVVFEQLRGSAFAPVTIEAPRLEAEFAAEHYYTTGEERVAFRSRSMRGSGAGFDAKVREGIVSFSKGAEVKIDLEGGRRLQLDTPVDGSLTIVDESVGESEPTDEEEPELLPPGVGKSSQRRARVFARDGVHVEVSAPDDDPLLAASDDPAESGDPSLLRKGAIQPLVIDAASVELAVVMAQEGADPVIESARADGEVEIRHGRDLYRGDTARVYFEDGVATRVVIEQDPILNYILTEEDGTEVNLRITGTGPVTGHLVQGKDAPQLRFLFAGPGRIEAVGRGGVVSFENEARGSGLEDRSEAIVMVSGDVRVETPEGTLTSESIIATYEAGADLRVGTSGLTRVIGKDAKSGDEYHVRAGRGMAAHLVNESWFVDRAQDVYAEYFGDEPHRVRAGVVRDVDVGALTLVAEDSIYYESLWGRAYAKRALARTSDSVELMGTADDPVVLDLVELDGALVEESADSTAIRSGWIRSAKIRLDATEIIAEGSVAAQVETLEGVWGFDADELSVRREVVGESFVLDAGSPGPALGALQPGKHEDIFVAARFVREARYDTDMGNSVFAADQIELEASAAAPQDGDPGAAGRATLDPDRPALLRAEGRVSVSMESYGPERNGLGLPTVQQTWNLEAASASFERSPRGPGVDAKVPFSLLAEKVSECRMAGAGRYLELSAETVQVDGEFGALQADRIKEEGADIETLDLTGSALVARGAVDMRYKASPDQPSIRSRCHELTLLDGKRGSMKAERGQRVRCTGFIPGNEIPYTLQATLVRFTKDELVAEALEGTMVKVQLQKSISAGPMYSSVDEIIAKKLTATSEYIELLGSEDDLIELTGTDSNGVESRFTGKNLTLATKDLRIREQSPRTISPFEPVPLVPNAPQDDEEEPTTRSDGGEYRFGDIEVKMDRFEIDPKTGVLVFQNASVQLASQGISLDAESLSFDRESFTFAAGRGAVRGSGDVPWTLSFASIDSRELDDEIMFVITAPEVTFGRDSARADYLSVWIDRARWQDKGERVVRNDKSKVSAAEEDPPATKPNFLAELLFEMQDQEYGSYLRALYMEGGVEVAREDRRAARGSRLFIDLPKAVAWLEDAELVYPLQSKGQEVPLRVRTQRLGTDEKGALTAKDATLTTCNHDVPHFVVLTRLFKLEPRDDGRWRFGASGNKLKFDGGWSLPLPAIGNLVLDEEFGIEGFENEAGEVTPLRDIGVARTARFGTVLGAAFRFDVGDIGNWFAERIGMDSSKLRGKWETEAQYLGSRGPLVGLGLQLRERKPGDDPDEDFRLDAFVGGIVDDGDDRGTVRVPEQDREDLRISGYLRARYPIVRGEWVDVAFASQTDAAVQSEFYEGDYLRFEQRDTFVRWRKAIGADYFAAGAQKRVNDFRSQKEELPSIGAYRGERQVGTFTGVPLLWGGAFDAGYFTRREGDPGFDLFSDLPGGALVGTGNQETARADLRQRLSLPIQTTVAGIKATPFAEVRGTAWTHALDDGDDPRRGGLFTGLELSTTLHKVTGNGYLHALAPRISYTRDVASDRTGGSLIPLDPTEEPFDGTRYEAGLRSLWQRPATFENLDVDLRAILREDRDEGLPNSSELAINAKYITRYGDGTGTIGVRHDARYDMESSETSYSRSALAVRPNDAFLVEFRYSQARAIDAFELYETGGILGRWRVDPKWELETRYIHDLKNDRQLLTELTVRRYAHDFVFDMTFQDRAGEGGTNISLNLAPLLGWASARLGMLDR